MIASHQLQQIKTPIKDSVRFLLHKAVASDLLIYFRLQAKLISICNDCRRNQQSKRAISVMICDFLFTLLKACRLQTVKSADRILLRLSKCYNSHNRLDVHSQFIVHCFPFHSCLRTQLTFCLHFSSYRSRKFPVQSNISTYCFRGTGKMSSTYSSIDNETTMSSIVTAYS